jgi:hypothetical protein
MLVFGWKVFDLAIGVQAIVIARELTNAKSPSCIPPVCAFDEYQEGTCLAQEGCTWQGTSSPPCIAIAQSSDATTIELANDELVVDWRDAVDICRVYVST